jgi:hypothetical protein
MLAFKIVHADGRFTYNAAAVHRPGDIVTRPDGTLAHFDGLEDCKIGQAISPCPLKPHMTGEGAKVSGDNIAAGADVYRRASDGLLTVTSSGNVLIGKAVAAAAAGTTLVHVNLGT